jgi:hypothetical protein
MKRILTAAAAILTGVSSANLRGKVIQSTSYVKVGQCNVLALSGGGAFGAVEMGMIDGLIGAGSIPSKYDIVTGISAGGLNAGFLSYYANVSEALPDIYGILSNLTTADVYQSAILDILSEWSYYSTKPLANTLENILANKVAEPGSPMTLIGASNVLEQRLDVWHFERLALADKLATLMATSAIPLVFPPQKINGSLYVDGGVISNEMIHQAIGQLSCDSYQVVFISASGRNQTALPMPTGIWSYMGVIVDLLVDTFDYQLAQPTSCTYPRGSILACFPSAPSLENYSILDFDFGAQLYQLGKEQQTCTTMQLC